jgi:hypothetical protein
MSKSKPVPAEPQPLFLSFEWSPPSTEACRDAVYAAFERHEVGYSFCNHCFEPEQERVQRLPRDIRTAGADIFDMIYFEHPECSGGVATFLHWLPRGLELSFFDERPYPSLLGQMVRAGLPIWPREEREALRQLFCRAMLNWAQTDDPAPLGVIRPSDSPRLATGRRRTATIEILSALILLRIDMTALFRALIDWDRDDFWFFLLSLCRSDDAFLDDYAYYVLDDPNDLPAMREGIAALQRRARDEAFRLLDRETLLAKWLSADEENPQLAEEIAHLEALYDVYYTRQSDDERAVDERLIAEGFKLSRV